MEVSSIAIHDVVGIKLRDAEHLDSGCHVRQLTIHTSPSVRFTVSLFADNPKFLDVVKEG